MAFNHSIIRLVGTLDTVNFYKRDGQYHVRNKSSLLSRQFWKNRAFEGSRKSCKRFGEGNKLASQVYRDLPAEKRHYALFCQLKTMAIAYLKQEFAKEDIIPLLQQRAAQEAHVMQQPPNKKRVRKAFPYAIEITPDYVALTMGRFLQLEKKWGRDVLLEKARSLLFSNTSFYQISCPFRAIRA